MRGLTSSTFRVLRSITTSRIASQPAAFRPLCVASPSADSKPESDSIDRPLSTPVDPSSFTSNVAAEGGAEADAVIVEALSVDGVTENDTVTSATETDEETVAVAASSDATTDDGMEQQLQQQQQQEQEDVLEMNSGNLDVVDDTLRQVPTKGVDLSQFSTPEDLYTELQNEVETRFTRCMLQFRQALEEEGSPLVSKASIDLMLPVMARNGWYRTVMETLRVAEEKDIQLNTLMYNCALFAMTRTGELELMKEVIAKMLAVNKARPNATSYNLLIAATFYRGSVDDAFAVLDDMRSTGIAASLATYQTLVSGCMRRREYERAVDTFYDAEAAGKNMNAMTVAQLLFFAAHRDNYDNVDALMTKVESLLPLYRSELGRVSARRSTFFRNDPNHQEDVRGLPRLELSLIQAILQSACRGKRPDLAVRVWELHRDMYPELEPTEDMWLSLISSLAAAGDFEAAFDGIAHMRAAGFSPALNQLNFYMIKPLSRDIAKIDDLYYYLSEQLDGAADTLVENDADADVEAEPVETDVQAAQVDAEEEVVEEASNTAEMASVEQTTEEEGSGSLADEVTDTIEMKDEEGGDANDTSGHVSLSEAIGLSGSDEDGGRYKLPWASQPRAELGMTEFNVIILACSLAGDIDRAFQTYDEACGRLGLTRDSDTLNALLEGCIQTGHIRGGSRVMEEARNDGTLYDPETIHLVARLYSRSARYIDAYDFIREADDNGATMYARTLQMLGRQLKKSNFEEEYDDVVAMGIRMGYRDTAIRSMERGAQRPPFRKEHQQEMREEAGAVSTSDDDASALFEAEQAQAQQEVKMDS